MEDDALQVADAQEVIAQGEEQHWTFRKAKATRLCPEGDQGDERGEETSHSQDEDPRLGDLLLVGGVQGIGATLGHALVEEEGKVDGTRGDGGDLLVRRWRQFPVQPWPRLLMMRIDRGGFTVAEMRGQRLEMGTRVLLLVMIKGIRVWAGSL